MITWQPLCIMSLCKTSHMSVEIKKSQKSAWMSIVLNWYTCMLYISFNAWLVLIIYYITLKEQKRKMQLSKIFHFEMRPSSYVDILQNDLTCQRWSFSSQTVIILAVQLIWYGRNVFHQVNYGFVLTSEWYQNMRILVAKLFTLFTRTISRSYTTSWLEYRQTI